MEMNVPGTPWSPVRAVVWTALLVVTACGGEGGAQGQDAGEMSEATSTAAAGERIFDESVEEDECAVLTAEDVNAAVGAPLDGIEQEAWGGVCLYSWDAGSSWSDGSLAVLDVTVHESLDRARSEYARFTEDVTAEEVGEGKDRVQEDLEGERAAGEISPSEEALADALVETMPEMDFTHRRWDGIGSAASTDGHGTVRVRYGNVTVWIVGKTAGEDWLDPEVARNVARRVVAQLDGMG